MISSSESRLVSSLASQVATRRCTSPTPLAHFRRLRRRRALPRLLDRSVPLASCLLSASVRGKARHARGDASSFSAVGGFTAGGSILTRRGGRACGRRARRARGASWRWGGWRPGRRISPRGPRPGIPPGIYTCYPINPSLPNFFLQLYYVCQMLSVLTSDANAKGCTRSANDSLLLR